MELKYTPEREIIYHSGLRDITFWDDVVLGKSNEKIIQKKGWEYNFLDVVAIRIGEYRDVEGSIYLSTKGTGVRLAGVLKMFDRVVPILQDNTFWRLLCDHFDLRYAESTYETEPGHPLDGVKFKSISVWLH